MSALSLGTVAKRLQLLHELVPAAAHIAFLSNPTNPYYVTLETTELQSAATALGLRLLLLNASTTGEIEVAFTTLVERRADAFLLGTDPFFMTVRDQLVALANGQTLVIQPDVLVEQNPTKLAALAIRERLPALYSNREFAEVGGLMTYGSSIIEAHRQTGIYAARILKGERPGDLPVQQATKFEFVINLKTAKELGLTVPQSLIAAADEVVE